MSILDITDGRINFLNSLELVDKPHFFYKLTITNMICISINCFVTLYLKSSKIGQRGKVRCNFAILPYRNISSKLTQPFSTKMIPLIHGLRTHDG